MGEIIKEAFEIVKNKFKNSKGFKVVLIVIAAFLILASAFTAYPSVRAGAVALVNDVFGKDTPELYDVTYDDASKTIKGSIKGIDNPDEYRLILFILTDQWYVKPDFNGTAKNGMSELQTKDRFLINAFTQDQYENDIKATQYTVFIVPSSYSGLKHMNDFDGAKDACVYSYTDTIP